MLLFILALFATAAYGLHLDACLSRRGAVLGAAATAATALSQPARAGGTGKDDKAFQSCLSQCVYEATKITKGIGKVEVMDRSEAFKMCKPKCATSKDQLLLGQPKKQ